MLNITENYTEKLESLGTYKTVKDLNNRPHYKILNKVILGSCIFAVLFLFLPWTQNISGTGSVTTLKPNQRPQTIHTGIAGRIEKWYVQEGDFIKKDIRKFAKKENWDIISDYHFGGYGKVSDDLIEFINDFYKKYKD